MEDIGSNSRSKQAKIAQDDIQDEQGDLCRAIIEKRMTEGIKSLAAFGGHLSQ